MTKILNVKIKDGGFVRWWNKTSSFLLEIETDNDDDYKYIWLNADDLKTISEIYNFNMAKQNGEESK